MAKAALTQDEINLQGIIARGEYAEAREILARQDNSVRPLYRAIFEAAIALATGENEKTLEVIAEGLRLEPRNYELYVMLGDYYASRNMYQTYLCYENALYYCREKDDREQIRLMLEEQIRQGYAVPRAAIVILSYNLWEMTRDCIESIRNTTPASAREIIVVDNASKDNSVAWLKIQRDIKLLCNEENKGFPAACNQGIELADADSDIFLLNNDTVMTENALFWLRMGLYEEERVGSAGSVTNHMSNRQTIVEDGKSRKEYLDFARKTNVPMEHPYQNKLYLTGFALLLKRDVLRKIGLLDERFSPGNYEDNDICMRINLAGYRNVLCRNSFIIHWGSRSFGRDPEKFQNVLDINQKKFFKKWSSIQIEPEGYWNHRLDLFPLIAEKGDISSGTILVVGTGCGIFLSELQGSFPEARIFGMEQHQYMARIADQIAETFWVDFDQWAGDELADTFDLIVINEALEQTKYPERLVKELLKTLKKDGKIIVSFKNGKQCLCIENTENHGGMPGFQ